MKVASHHVRATQAQSIRWKRAAGAEGFSSVGQWAAQALDAYLEHRSRAGRPLPLAWHLGQFQVRLDDGSEPTLKGWLSRPFGIFHGSPEGPIPHGSTHTYSLVYLPDRRILATFRRAGHCRSLAAELAAAWVRLGGREPAEDPAPVLDRHVRESL